MFFFGGRELPRDEGGPTLSGRHAKRNKRGHRGRIHFVLRGREGAQKDGGPPFRCEPAFPRPSAAMETDSARKSRLRPDASVADADFSIRQTKPANRGFPFPRFSSSRNFEERARKNQSISINSRLLRIWKNNLGRIYRTRFEISNTFRINNIPSFLNRESDVSRLNCNSRLI